jgi:hypothetical protein
MQSIELNNSKRIKTPRIDKEKWAQLILEWEKSNESQTAFCNRLNLNIHTFTYVRDKVLKDALSKKFIPVSIQEENSPSPLIADITLENPKGFKLHIPSLIADEQLIHLLKLVGW